jgi:hypothetical protein
MFGHPAAAMQLRMGNLPQACVVYRKLLSKHPDDEDARTMVETIEALLRATRGEPVEVWAADTHLGEDDGPGDLEIPATTVTAIAERPSEAPEESGPVMLGAIPDGLGGEDEGSTTEMPSAPQEAERLLAEGKLEEAELIYRSLAAANPEDAAWARRADEVRSLRAGDPGVVLVRAIRTVK